MTFVYYLFLRDFFDQVQQPAALLVLSKYNLDWIIIYYIPKNYRTNYLGHYHSLCLLCTAGLSLALYIEQRQYLPAFADSAGVRVTIHRQDQQPFPESDGFNVLPGVKTSIMLKTVRSSFIY